MYVEPLLRELAGSRRALAPFRRLVEPLLAYDPDRRSDLLCTLRVYFAANANASEAADRVFLHRNSMLDRLARVQKLVSLDLREPETKLALQVELLLSTLKRGAFTMKLSTRNRLPGEVTEVVKGEAAAKVTVRVGDNHMVALITRESADELGLEVGRQVTALVKATDVMLLTNEGGVA